MSNDRKAWIAVEDGTVLEGRAVGAAGERGGDLVFNTAMSGYHEILTDPSYAGQVVLMTYPLIGNYGVAEEDAESDRAWAESFVVREMSAIPSNHRADCSLPEWLRKHDVVAIEGVDTRLLTKLVRERGSMRCIVSTVDGDHRSLVDKARNTPSTDGRDLASVVSTDSPYDWSEPYPESYPTIIPKAREPRRRIVAYDFGIKRNILRSLHHCGFDVRVVSAHTAADDVLAMDPEGVFLSNGPGDPAAVSGGIDAVSNLLGKVPVFGICLGHQILGLAMGGTTFKLDFGHRGLNHPCGTTGQVEITSQNHGFAIDAQTLPASVEVTHLNLNDRTVAAMAHREQPLFGVQYHPEASPGPHDADHHFGRFVALMAERR